MQIYDSISIFSKQKINVKDEIDRHKCYKKYY